MTKEKETVEHWNGPVCVVDRYYSDEDSAIESELDRSWCPETGYDFEGLPEFMECCDETFPTYDVENLIEHIDEDDEFMVIEDCDDSFRTAVDEDLQATLQKLVNAWIEEVGWQVWKPNGKLSPFRDKCIAYAKEQHD